MLNPDQLAMLKTNTQTTGAPGMAPGQAMTPEQAHQWIGGSSSTSQDIGTRVTQDIAARQQNVQDIKAAPQSMPSKLLQTGGQAAGAALDIGGEAMKSAHVPEAIGALSKLPGPVNAAFQLLQSQPVQEAIASGKAGYDAWKAGNPEAAGNLEAVVNIGSLIPIGAGAKVAEESAVTAAKGALTPVAETAEQTAARTASAKAAEAAQNQASIKKIADRWAQPTVPGKSRNPGSFKAASAILKQNPKITQFLAEQKINPYDHVEGIKDPRYNTIDTAASLREDAGQLSRDRLRVALKNADYSTQKTPVEDVLRRAVADAKQDPMRTPGQEEKMVADLAKEGEALQRKYPDGMTLTQMHDNKIPYAANGGYKPVGTEDNMKATMNRNMGSALQHMVEEKAPEGLDVRGFNRGYLSQYYKAADYLDALHTKKVPVSLASDIMHRSASVLGAVAGHTATGGMLGGVAGYVLGGTLEHLIEHLAPNMRGQFLQDLRVAHPEAVKQIDAYIASEKAAQGSRLALPPGKKPGEPGAPAIQLPAGEGKSSVTSVAAQKNPVSVNPKSGKFQTSYNMGTI